MAFSEALWSLETEIVAVCDIFTLFLVREVAEEGITSFGR